MLPPPVAMLLFALLGASQQEAHLPFDLEGPLNNDAFAAVNETAQADLARGDRSWKRALAHVTAGSRERGLAFEAWHAALEGSATGDAVALQSADVELRGLWPDGDGTHARRTEGVSYAVLRRLHALDDLAAREWVTRFEPLAEAALQAAGASAESLARVERNEPWTRAAALACLRLADLALERGATEDAYAWLARAAEHARGRVELEGAIDRRRTEITAWHSSAVPPVPGPVPSTFELVRTERLEGFASAGLRQTLRGGLEPGLAFTPQGSVIVQSPVGLVHYRDEARTRGPRTLRTRFNDLLGENWNTPYVTTAEGGWPLLPVVAGDYVVVVVGRSIARARGVSFGEGRERDSSPTNILACLRLDASGLPTLVWKLSGEGLARADGSLIRADPFGTDDWEVQPGPCLQAGRVFAAVRASRGRGGDDELWLWSFDLVTGEPGWSRFLTKASALPGEAAARGRQLPTPAQPLTVVEQRLFVGTNAGLGLCFDTVDGRLVWSFKNRRRTPAEDGWSGARRAPWFAGAAGSLLAWTPYDSDRLYTLVVGPDLDGRGLMQRPDLAPISAGAPFALDQAEELATLSPGEILVLGRSGARAAVSAWLPDGESAPSLYLGRGESFAGGAWSSERRLVAASTRYLYLFDRDRGLRLMDARALADAGGGRGGSVYTRGDALFVVGPDTLWHFQLR